MATKKDMRRPELFIPFIEPEPDKNAADMSATIASTVPMAAIFSRQKMIGWVAVVFSLQHFLEEPPGPKPTSGSPAWFSVLMAFMSLAICYMPLFMPPPPQAQSATGAPPPAPASTP